jgi:hypothetical protein
MQIHVRAFGHKAFQLDKPFMSPSLDNFYYDFVVNESHNVRTVER